MRRRKPRNRLRRLFDAPLEFNLTMQVEVWGWLKNLV
jgi:hypothetical protein